MKSYLGLTPVEVESCLGLIGCLVDVVWLVDLEA